MTVCDENRHYFPPKSPVGTPCECGEVKVEVYGQRGPFKDGNEARVTHGAGQPNHPRPKHIAEVQDAADAMIANVAHLDPLDRGEVVRLLVAEKAAEKLLNWLEDNPDDRGASSLLRQWITTASNLAKSLGLTPKSRADLKLTEVRGENEVMDAIERGRRARLERVRRLELVEAPASEEDADEPEDAA